LHTIAAVHAAACSRFSVPVLFLAASFALAGALRSAEDAPADPRLAHGRELFRQNCTSCHGADGRAKTPIARQLKVKDLTASTASDEVIAEAVREGRRNSRDVVVMPPFKEKFTAADVELLVEYVKGLRAPAAATE
jgi:cytochrome c oxidase cbb3-type subunit III